MLVTEHDRDKTYGAGTSGRRRKSRAAGYARCDSDCTCRARALIGVCLPSGMIAYRCCVAYECAHRGTAAWLGVACAAR
jgi:hypothetical protein